MPVRSTVAFWVGGALLEIGCTWVQLWSPRLTAIYAPEFTSAFFAWLPWLRIPLPIDLPDAPSMVVVLELGLATMIAGYLVGVAALGQQNACHSTWIVSGFALLFRLTLFLLPGLFSTDVFSYVMYGRIAAIHNANPYVDVPDNFPDDPFLGWVFPFWRATPTVYGPLWTDFSWLLSKVTGELSSFDQTLVYRLSIVAFDLLSLWLVWRLLGWIHPGNRRAREVAFCVFAWNPLVLFDIVGNTHNDAAMVTLLLGGILLTARGRDLAGVLAITLSALVKYTTVLALPLVICAGTAKIPVIGRRLASVALMASGILALTLLTAWPWLTAPGGVGNVLQVAGGPLVINSAPIVVALTVADQVLVPLGMSTGPAEDISQTWTRIITRVIFAVYFIWELARLYRHPERDSLNSLRAVLAATTRALLIFPLLVLTWVWSWYLSWSLAVGVLLGWRSWLTRLVVLYSLIDLPIVYAHQYLNQDLPGIFVVLFALAPLVVWSAWRRLGLDH